MCNDYRLRLSADEIATVFSEIRIPLRFTGGVPNLEPRDDVRIGDTAPIVRRAENGAPELVQLRWSWPGPTGKPVFNFRSEGRRFDSGRCLIPADAFYEFTTPPEGSPKRARKSKWEFRLAEEPWFCIAGLWRPYAGGEAFTMLTTSPGPDIAPYHDRQIVVLGKRDWVAWLDGPEPQAVLKPSAAGALSAKLIGSSSDAASAD
jgi:putative SOS response-associated peptidase YedK